jgi:Transposase DDE domain
LFAAAKDTEARRRSRQQAAEDLLWTIEHFAECPEWTGRSTYEALVTIFGQQCEVHGEAVVVKARTGGDRIRNPSDRDATYGAHEGPGYQVPLAETCRPTDAVQLITAALPQTACEADGAAVVPMLDQLAGSDRLPEERVADTPYCSDENVQAAAARGVDLVGPIPGREPARDAAALTVDDLAVDERTGQVEACPSGQVPLAVERDAAAGTTRIEMAAAACGGCPFRAACPIHPTRDGRYTWEFSDKEHRPAGRRREQEAPVFAERSAPRAGIESTNSGLKNRPGMDRLRVRGRGRVSRVILHKAAGWNVRRAAASTRLRARVKAQVEQALKAGETGANEPAGAPVSWPWGGWLRAFRSSPGHSHRWAASHAARAKIADPSHADFCR